MPPNIPPNLVTVLASSSSTEATDALEEWISHRRSKGDTLFEVSVGLAELEAKTPPHLGRAFDRARYLTNVPPPSDLTPPMGPFPLARSASPATIINHLLSQPPPSIEHSREVILEFVLAREIKLREKKPGRGGRGTLGRDDFEEIGARLSEIESQLQADDEINRALLLSLRMSLSYFTLPGLAQQLLSSAVPVAERILIQHIRKRVQGEGRYGVGKELEFVEDLTSQRRALRPAFRSAKARTTLPQYPNYPIALPAPAKAGCIRLLSAFVKDVEVGGAAAVMSYTQPPLRSPASPGIEHNGFNVRKHPIDKSPIANYALELVSEYLAREKREYMSKMKWAKSGRDQLSKDLGDIESSFCSGKSASVHAPTLLPVFLLLRRNYNLPESPLPKSITEPYYDILPAPPEPDDVPFREPTISTTTASLYVNPRLDDDDAAEVLDEFIESEKEKLLESPERDMVLLEEIEAIEKRFPDGSYASVFDQAKQLRSPQKPAHRRAVSSSVRPPPLSPPNFAQRNSHLRSVSLPGKRDVSDDSDISSDSSEDERPNLSIMTATVVNAGLAPTPVSASAGWWDVVSAVQDKKQAPWEETRPRSASKTSDLPLPPGAEPAHIPDSPGIANLTLSSPPATPPRHESPARPARRAMTMQTPNRDLAPPPPIERATSDSPSGTPPSQSPSSAALKSKFGTFGRSMTLGKKKEKEKDKTLNNPGKWNKDMVASIMGPPNK